MLKTLLAGDRLGEIEVEYVEKILAAFPPQKRSGRAPAPRVLPAIDALIDPLSKRELEILDLIEAGCTNQEIAERLVVTLHTVKKHSSNIYAKLGVSSRTQAVARARQLKLL